MQMRFYLNGEPVSSTIDEDKLKETSNFMYKLLLAIGIVVMFIVGTIIGIQFLVASAEDKAKLKESLVPYVAGCIVIFGAFTIWSIVVDIGQDTLGGDVIFREKQFVLYNEHGTRINIYSWADFSHYFNGTSVKPGYEDYMVEDYVRANGSTYSIKEIPNRYGDYVQYWN